MHSSLGMVPLKTTDCDSIHEVQARGYGREHRETTHVNLWERYELVLRISPND